MKKFFRYIQPLWTGSDGKISLRHTLAITFSINLIQNMSYAIRKWGADRSLGDLSLTLGIEAGIIVALLGLSTYQNLQTMISANKTSVEINTPTTGTGAAVKVETPSPIAKTEQPNLE